MDLGHSQLIHRRVAHISKYGFGLCVPIYFAHDVTGCDEPIPVTSSMIDGLNVFLLQKVHLHARQKSAIVITGGLYCKNL